MKDRAARESKIRDHYRSLKGNLTERARRLSVANEGIAFGFGGIAAAARATGMAPSVIGRRMAEVRAIENGTASMLPHTRSRRPGGGRKKATETDPTLLPDLKTLVESTTRGDPESPLLWTARSQRSIVAALKKQGHQTSMRMVSRLLKELGYSLQANRKRLEGAQHPDRNAQFEHINETIRRRLKANEPVISVDTRKKELELQELVDELGFPVTVCHLPPGTSKWNKNEHRLFSFITQNWRGKPLVAHQVIVNLIAATTTKKGLVVRSRLDDRAYPKGRRVSDTQLALVNLEPHAFHGEWNYTIHPSTAA